MKKDYEDIPGTFVFDADRSREGYHLNQFCISLRLQKNRDAFNADEEAYLDKYPMTAEQRAAVRARLEPAARTGWQYLLHQQAGRQ
jgi:protocatechuate 4,5-dioxygenase alpha chain